VLASRDGKIVCENTLDARLDVVFRKKLPEVNILCILILTLDFVSFVRYFLLNCSVDFPYYFQVGMWVIFEILKL